MSLNPKAKESIARTMLTDRFGNSAMFEFAAVTTVDINSQKVFRDVAFTISRRFAMGASATVDIVFDPTAIPSDRMLVVLPLVFTAFGAGPINIDTYFSVDSDEDGTLWSFGNRDFRSPTIAASKIRLNPTINNAGIKTPFEFMIPSDGVPATSTAGGQTKEDLIIIARTDGKYMFRLINTEANIASCHFSMTIFEAIEGE